MVVSIYIRFIGTHAQDDDIDAQKDLIPIFGSNGKASEILNGKRQLSLTMIRKLANELGIPAAVLLQERGATHDDDARGTIKSP